ncbi:MAG: stage II sporulation protein D, partial [Oscillospiraceae bacterium]
GEKFFEGGEIIVFDEANGKILTLTEREYVLGATLCEMPASYEPEALKAQAVACHTYALFVKKMRQSSPDPNLKSAYFTVNSSMLEGYMSIDRAKSYFKDSFSEYYSKVSAAVDEVLAQVLTYDGELISSCYHAISGGRTEASENVFAAPRPYLVSVDSKQDMTAPSFESKVEMEAFVLEDKMKCFDAEFKATQPPSDWFGEKKLSDAKTVLTINICGRQYKGTQVREALNLRSAAFDVKYENEKFIFTVRGFGHGVGMSQYGANELAKKGWSYKEILAQYYKGTALSKAEGF